MKHTFFRNCGHNSEKQWPSLQDFFWCGTWFFIYRKSYQHNQLFPKSNSHNGFNDLRMSTHAEVVVTTPHRYGLTVADALT